MVEFIGFALVFIFFGRGSHSSCLKTLNLLSYPQSMAHFLQYFYFWPPFEKLKVDFCSQQFFFIGSEVCPQIQ